jgi:hypothetical protein
VPTSTTTPTLPPETNGNNPSLSADVVPPSPWIYLPIVNTDYSVLNHALNGFIYVFALFVIFCGGYKLFGSRGEKFFHGFSGKTLTKLQINPSQYGKFGYRVCDFDKNRSLWYNKNTLESIGNEDVFCNIYYVKRVGYTEFIYNTATGIKILLKFLMFMLRNKLAKGIE